MSKIMLYRFSQLDDFIQAMGQSEKEARNMEDSIPGLRVDMTSYISDKGYIVILYLEHEDENEQLY